MNKQIYDWYMASIERRARIESRYKRGEMPAHHRLVVAYLTNTIRIIGSAYQLQLRADGNTYKD